MNEHKLLFTALSLLLTTTLLLTGCAGRTHLASNDDYVEIDNPFAGDSPDANARIWVPRSSVEKGVPRGKELVRKGYDKLVSSTEAAPGVIDASAAPKRILRIRLLLAEAGSQTISAPLAKSVERSVMVRRIAPPSQSDAFTEKEALDAIAAVAGKAYGGPVLFLSKPEGTKPGAKLKADLYDVRGPSLIRSFWVTVPGPAGEETSEEALLSAVKGLADSTLSSLEWLTWYGRVVSVNGDRVYLDAGRETGLKAGQGLIVYRGGEAIKGIGFAPGPQVTSLSVKELVGPDGAYGVLPEAAKVLPGDYVELEKRD